MKKIPNLISSVSVRYFRSINALDMKKVEQVNIITGANDVGKSNLIRALNLFFNHSDDIGNDIIFSENFSHTRLSLSKEVNGQKLNLQPIPIVTKMNNIDINKVDGTEPWQMRISGDKMYFAQHIVPTFDKEDFVEFEALFKVIEKIIQKYE